MIGDTNNTMAGLMIGGPNATIYVSADMHGRDIEAIIYGICRQNGDEPDEYTVTEVNLTVEVSPQAVVTDGA